MVIAVVLPDELALAADVPTAERFDEIWNFVVVFVDHVHVELCKDQALVVKQDRFRLVEGFVVVAVRTFDCVDVILDVAEMIVDRVLPQSLERAVGGGGRGIRGQTKLALISEETERTSRPLLLESSIQASVTPTSMFNLFRFLPPIIPSSTSLVRRSFFAPPTRYLIVPSSN